MSECPTVRSSSLPCESARLNLPAIVATHPVVYAQEYSAPTCDILATCTEHTARNAPNIVSEDGQVLEWATVEDLPIYPSDHPTPAHRSTAQRSPILEHF
jgi:hypothetical protein